MTLPGRPGIPGHLGTIAFVIDERLSRQKLAILTRIINSLRTFARIELINGNISEEDLLQKLETEQYELVLAPWYRYLAWSKIEGVYGLTRTSGPTFAGYFSEPILPYELGEKADHLRAILLDFSNLDTTAIKLLVRALLLDLTRSGIRPLLSNSAAVYCESWQTSTGLGSRIDTIIALPEIAAHEWSRRVGGLRICLTALWSLIYEEGPGKGELKAATSRAPRAYFQIGADSHCLALRLCYSMPTWSPRDALASFWPDPAKPTAPGQLLLRYADFVRVHTIPEASDVEITIAFLAAAPAEKFFPNVHSLWIEPLSANVVKEMPFEIPAGPGQAGLGLEPTPHLKPLPRVSPEARPTQIDGSSSESTKARRFILEAAAKIRELKIVLTEQEDMIRELRSGGVGNARMPPPPDVEALLDAFQERYAEACFDIERLQEKASQLATARAPREEIDPLLAQVAAFSKREQVWVKKIMQVLESFRNRSRGTPERAAG